MLKANCYTRGKTTIDRNYKLKMIFSQTHTYMLKRYTDEWRTGL